MTVGTPAYMSGNCTPFTTINPGSYTFWLASAVRVAANKYVWAFADEDEEWQWNSMTICVASNPTGDTTIPVLFAGADWFAVSLVATLMGTAELVERTYKVYAIAGCEGVPGSSCTFDDVYLAPGHADRKSIIGHEIGHMVENWLWTGWSWNYNHFVATNVCRCDHAVTSNQIHCMQSREEEGAARREGWAHFYAASLFNLSTDSTAPFAYYKEVLDQNMVVHSPPVGFDALSVYNWTERFCLQANTNAEVDWMSALYFLHNKTAQRYTFPNLKDVFETAQSKTWAALRAAAESEFGVGSAKAQHLINSGDTYGVDH